MAFTDRLPAQDSPRTPPARPLRRAFLRFHPNAVGRLKQWVATRQHGGFTTSCTSSGMASLSSCPTGSGRILSSTSNGRWPNMRRQPHARLNVRPPLQRDHTGRGVRVPRSLLRSLLDRLDGWRVKDQIAFSGLEYDEESGKLRRKPSGLPPRAVGPRRRVGGAH
jgi:hypothetical protein